MNQSVSVEMSAEFILLLPDFLFVFESFLLEDGFKGLWVLYRSSYPGGLTVLTAWGTSDSNYVSITCFTDRPAPTMPSFSKSSFNRRLIGS